MPGAYDIVLLKDGKPKPLKLPAKPPRSFGPMVDAYKAWAEARLSEAKKAEDFATQEKALKAYLIDNLTKGDDGGAVGERYKAIVKNEDTYQVEDWDKLWAWIGKNNAYDVLARAINVKAITDRIDDMNAKVDEQNAKLAAAGKPTKPRKLIPGIKVFTMVKLSVTKK